MSMRPFFIAFAISICAIGIIGIRTAKAIELTFCAENKVQVPFIFGTNGGIPEDFPGLAVEMIRVASQRIEAQAVILRAPWNRCLLLLETNAVDGVFMGSFSPSRNKIAAYPMVDGHVDPSRRITTSSYSFFRRKGSSPNWDGQNFSGIKGQVGAPRGYSIVRDLKKRGLVLVEFEDTNKVFDMLVSRKIEVAAVQTSAGDALVSSGIFPSIELVEPPLAIKHYYVMLSKKLVHENGDLAKGFWREIASIREKEAKVWVQKYLK